MGAKLRCCNHPDRPVRPPSKVLCAECFAKLDAKFRALKAALADEPAAAPDGRTEGR